MDKPDLQGNPTDRPKLQDWAESWPKTESREKSANGKPGRDLKIQGNPRGTLALRSTKAQPETRNATVTTSPVMSNKGETATSPIPCVELR